MKEYILIPLKLTLALIILCVVVYTLVMTGIAKLAPGKGEGVTLKKNGKVVGYELIGQKFTQDKYFWGRPSAVDYNAAGSGGSNKGPSNPDYLKDVQNRIDSFLKHNPEIKKEDIPSEMVTASGSGQDPDISVKGAEVQIARIAKVRNISKDKLDQLIKEHTNAPLFGFLGPEKVNVLKLNLALDELKN
jgi:potassium-transporting ATPase KdpC subunit